MWEGHPAPMWQRSLVKSDISTGISGQDAPPTAVALLQKLPSHRSCPPTEVYSPTEVSLAYGLNSCHLTYDVQLQKAVVLAQFYGFNAVSGERRVLYHTFVTVVNRIKGDNHGAPRILGYVMG